MKSPERPRSDRPMPLRHLLAPRSIAIVGASDRPGSIGEIILNSLRNLGYDGQVWPINPKYPKLLGYECFASLGDLSEVPDVTAICLNGSSALHELGNLARIGARAAVMYDGGFAEAGEEGQRQQEQLLSIAQNAGMAVCGPNCMGIVNLVDGSSTYKLPILDGRALRGNIGLVSQSGSITIGLLSDTRRFGFSHVVSAGNEAVVTAGDYVNFLVDDENTEIIALFLEAVRNPAEFRSALLKAARTRKPVVVLKVGNSRRAMEAVASHTGGLAGEARVFSELLKTVGAIEVASLDEMTEILAAFQAKRLPQGERIAVVTGSGGHTELVLDTVDRAGLNLPPMQPREIESMRAAIGHFAGDGNPLDAWGAGDVSANLRTALQHFSLSPDYDAIVLCNENNENAAIGRSELACTVFAQSAATSEKPHYLLNTRPGLMHTGNLELLGGAGAAMLGGVRQGLSAIDVLARWSRTDVQSAELPVPRGENVLASMGARTTVNEYDAKALLREFGVPCVPELLTNDFTVCLAAAERFGWPVVLKVASDEVPHKTEAGLVVLSIQDASDLKNAWDVLCTRCAAMGLSKDHLLVQKMVKGGMEVFLGVKRDPAWGHVLAFGVGGILIELIDELELRLLPVSEAQVREMLTIGRAGKLLQGFRGRPAGDIQALVDCTLAVCKFVATCGDSLEEMDLNPILVLPQGQGCLVVDALIKANS
ncbi:acetate--CoA ligase family protein [Ottowia thiooxydans]|uniref:acetate--CoA ligase family protein n=1 Tax=Ottowia thiooxydans TaxID=219182 RepID=UPI000407EB98|nr:acetate--CoA ligase family protein [Ottowia thiooxydans]